LALERGINERNLLKEECARECSFLMASTLTIIVTAIFFSLSLRMLWLLNFLPGKREKKLKF